MVKKKPLIFAAMIILLTLIAAAGSHKYKAHYNDNRLKVGIAIYDSDDPYIQNLTNKVIASLEDKTFSGREIIYDIFDASGSTVKQNKQLYNIMQQEYDVILWNPVMPTNVMGVLEDAQIRNIPVIIFNREPARSDLDALERVWYVGTDAKEAGKMQGEMLIGAWSDHSIDKNQNGIVDYILVEGEQAHTDVINRTDAFLQTASAELSLNQLRVISANWMRDSAFHEMQNIPENLSSEAEAIICSNDSMALGVYDFYDKNHMEPPVIIGINGIKDMLDAIDSGNIYGTVDLNITAQSEKILDIIEMIAENLEEKEEEKIFYLPQYPYTK